MILTEHRLGSWLGRFFPRQTRLRPITESGLPDKADLQAREKLGDAHSQCLRDPHQRIYGDVFLAPLDLADVVRMKVRFLSSCFLRQARGSARCADRSAYNFPMVQTDRHGPQRTSPDARRPQSIACILPLSCGAFLVNVANSAACRSALPSGH
jgi:hypothetical protein